MSILQKIENSFLVTLRVIVLAISGLFLIISVYYGSSLLQLVQSKPHDSQVPTISSANVANAVLGENSDLMAKNNASQSPTGESKSAPDVNHEYYQQGSDAVSTYIKNVANEENPDVSKIYENLKRQAEAQSSPELVTAYAKGLADTLKSTLADSRVIARFRNEPEILNSIIFEYSAEFEKQANEAKQENIAQQGRYEQIKSEAVFDLFIASGAIGLFLFFMILLMLSKIEQNLRRPT